MMVLLVPVVLPVVTAPVTTGGEVTDVVAVVVVVVQVLLIQLCPAPQHTICLFPAATQDSYWQMQTPLSQIWLVPQDGLHWIPVVAAAVTTGGEVTPVVAPVVGGDTH
jgi:hypothetical protein